MLHFPPKSGYIEDVAVSKETPDQKAFHELWKQIADDPFISAYSAAQLAWEAGIRRGLEKAADAMLEK